jgi:hypothetical protein
LKTYLALFYSLITLHVKMDVMKADESVIQGQGLIGDVILK